MDVLTQSLFELKMRYNSLSITACLPDELLERIFMWNMSLQRKDKHMRYIRVAFVCASWRRIALGCPFLWSFIRPEQIKRQELVTSILLPRSKTAPLHIKARLLPENSMLEELHRIRELSFFCDNLQFPDSKFHQILARLLRPAPILEKFAAYASYTGSDNYLPVGLFDNHAPKLKTLKLSCCMIKTESPLLAGLTTLKLVACNLGIDRLITLLKATPNLTKLTLEGVCHGDSPAGPPPDVNIILPHLKVFFIRENCSVQILSCITRPSIMHLRLSSYSSRTPEYLCTLGQQVAACMPYIEQLVISRRYSTYTLHIHGLRNANDPSSTTLCTVIGEIVTLHGLKSFLDSLPLTQLESLHVKGELPTGFWVEMFAGLTSLVTIHAEGRSPQLLRALLCGISLSELANYLLIRDGDDMEDSPGSQHESDADGNNVAINLQTEHASSETDDEAEVFSWESEQEIQEDGESNEDDIQETSFSDTLPTLRLRRTPAPLRFTSLDALILSSWHSPTHPLDTTLLAALLHARYARGSSLNYLCVAESTHYTRNSEIDVDRMWDVVEYAVKWDVKDGLHMDSELTDGDYEDAQ
ncbi:hypothetical protein H0H92_007156 [Tricholoma furcatifolium]|nr:hypothetical protein H0H92_007156 [Tricholoma furcatifolium]